MTEQTIFLTALDLTDPVERTAYLEQTCGSDAALRRQVDSLLAAHDRSGLFLDEPALEQVAARPMARADSRTVDANAPAGPDTPTLTSPRSAGSGNHDLGFLQPPTRPGALGRLDRYEVLEVIGRGGFGTVLRAFDDRLHRVVAIKVLAPQLATSGSARARFNREARAGAAVRDEHVVSIHEVSQPDEPVPYLVMEYVAGQTLQQKLDRTGPLSVPEILRIGSQIARGLAAAHATGHIHRDVKPSNILLENGVERVKLTDFGLARAADDASISHSGVVAGTPSYMAPEQAHGGRIDHRADLFSLGSVLYAMCTGRPPFRASTTMAVLKRVCEADPRPIGEINPEVPEWLSAVIAKLHAKKPEDRIQTAREVANLLQQHLAHLRQPNQVPMPVPAGRPSRPPRARRRPWRRWAGRAAVLLVILWGAFWFGPAALRYLGNRGEVAFSADGPGLMRVTVSRDGQKVTDFDPATNPTIELPPGKYSLVPTPVPGRAVDNWELNSFDMFTGRIYRLPGHSCEFDLKRGQHVSVRALMGDSPPLSPIESTADGFVQLFNGKNLNGWTRHALQPGQWRVEDGVLVGSGATSHLFTTRGDYADFHLRLEACINVDGDSGVMFRCAKDTQRGEPFGYEAEIAWSVIPSSFKTGSLYCRARDSQNRSAFVQKAVEKDPIQPDTWFTLELIAQGNHFVTKVNGKEVASAVNDEYRAGFIALQVIDEQTVVKFRKIEIKELPAVAQPGLVKLRSFTPGKDPLPLPRRGPAKAVTVVGDSWRIENTTDAGNFNVMVAQNIAGLPKDGVLVFRARVKVEAQVKESWGDLGFGAANEVFPSWKQWPDVRARYDGNDSAWVEKEVRYPVADIKADPPTVYLYAGLHANGVLWLKNVELLHLPAKTTGAPNGGQADSTPVKLQSFPAGRTTVTRIGVRSDGNGYRIDNDEPRDVHLFNVNVAQLPRVTVDGGVLWVKAQIKTEGLLGRVSPRLTARWADGRALVADTVDEASGSSDWTWRQVRLPLNAGERPDFADLGLFVNGKGTVWIKDVELFYDPPGAGSTPGDQPPAERVKTFTSRDTPLTPVAPGDNRSGWRIEAKADRTAPLFEVKAPPKGPGYLVWRAKMKTEGVTGEAYLEALGLTANPRLDTAKSYTSAKGTSDWTYYDVAVPMQGNQMPAATSVAVVIKGGGTVWVKDVELLRLPPVSKGAAKDMSAPQIDGEPTEIGPPPRLIANPPTKK